MSKDPAFLFYDADAARDVSHLNRLERGCYFDLIQAQKKFGRMNLELIRKVLGNDFASCWQNLEISLYCENNGFYIPWLEDSISKRKAYCQSRGRNRLGAKKRKSADGGDGTKVSQNHLFRESAPVPVATGEKFTMNDLKEYFAQAQLKKEQIGMLYKYTPSKLERLIARFCLKENNYVNRKDALVHFLYWLDRQKNPQGDNDKTFVEKWME